MRSSLSFLVVIGVLGVAGVARAGNVAVDVDATKKHQIMEGFGATTISLVFGSTDNLTPTLRTQALQALYRDVRLNMGNLEVGPFESPANALYSPANDDADPSTINPNGFNWTQSDNMFQKVVDPAKQYGFDNYWLGPAISERFEFGWAGSLRGTNYTAYLDECAEHVAALAIHWRDAYGITPPLMQLWNEPRYGNREMEGASIQELADIVKVAGARLRKEGFANMRFVVPADETEDVSLQEAAGILGDAQARPYVGAIAYHPYPYGSTYASVPNILATSGSGNPETTRVQVRNQLRDLGKQYGIPVFMIEVSHSDAPFGSFDAVRGRAIHIHDELVYADASAFFGMNAMWDTITNDEHYAGRDNPGLFADSDTIVLIDDAAGKTPQVYISEMGYAIGHYARWISKGSVRVDATSSDPLVQVTAFADDAKKNVSVVVINNAQTDRVVDLTIGGVALAPQVVGEQSTSSARWTKLTPPNLDASGHVALTLPALSVTSVGLAMPGGTAGNPPGPSGGGGAGGSADAGAGSPGGAGATGSSANDGGSGAPSSHGAEPGGSDADSAASGCAAAGNARTRGTALPIALAFGMLAYRRARRRLHPRFTRGR